MNAGSAGCVKCKSEIGGKVCQQRLRNCYRARGENDIFPFFWQHGEEEGTLRRYMQVIDEANCHAVCVESRPHPDFCGPGWWRGYGHYSGRGKEAGYEGLDSG